MLYSAGNGLNVILIFFIWPSIVQTNILPVIGNTLFIFPFPVVVDNNVNKPFSIFIDVISPELDTAKNLLPFSTITFLLKWPRRSQLGQVASNSSYVPMSSWHDS